MSNKSNKKTITFPREFMVQLFNIFKKGHQLKVEGLGTFTVKEFAARKLSLAKTGKLVKLPKRKVLTFVQDQAIRERINK